MRVGSLKFKVFVAWLKTVPEGTVYSEFKEYWNVLGELVEVRCLKA